MIGRANEMLVEKRSWQCPQCRQEYWVPALKRTPEICPECRDGISISSPEHEVLTVEVADRKGFTYGWMVFVTGLMSFTSCLTVIVAGVSPISLVIVLVQVASGVTLAWYGHQPSGEPMVRWLHALARQTLLGCRKGLLRLRDAYRRSAERRRILRELRRQAHLEGLERQRAAEQRLREELARARRPDAVQWPCTRAVDASRAVTYGVGEEFVYCYTFPSALEIAEFRSDISYRIKVGMAARHPIDRIHEQVSASKTAICEQAVALLVFRTGDCRHLEQWLHGRLDRDHRALGREWFTTNPDELIGLFQAYLDEFFPAWPVRRNGGGNHVADLCAGRRGLRFRPAGSDP